MLWTFKNKIKILISKISNNYNNNNVKISNNNNYKNNRINISNNLNKNNSKIINY